MTAIVLALMAPALIVGYVLAVWVEAHILRRFRGSDDERERGRTQA